MEHIRHEIDQCAGRDVSIGAIHATVERLEKKECQLPRSAKPRPREEDEQNERFAWKRRGPALPGDRFFDRKSFAARCEADLFLDRNEYSAIRLQKTLARW